MLNKVNLKNWSEKFFDDRVRLINRLWQSSYVEAASVDSDCEPKKMVLGVDIGGTSFKWKLFEVDSKGSINPDPVAEGKTDSEAGITPYISAFQDILIEAIEKAAENGGVLAGVGLGTPGRFVNEEQYEKSYGTNGPSGANNRQELTTSGDPRGKYMQPSGLDWKAPSTHIMAPGSNPYFVTKDGEFDKIDIWSFFQRFMPAGLQLNASNDAAVQFVGIIAALKRDGMDFEGKKVIYGGPGTGYGGAVLSPEGDLVTDGHYQYMKLYGGETVEEKEIFDIIHTKNKDVYDKFPDNNDYIIAEDIQSGTGIEAILEHVYRREVKGREFDGIYANTDDKSEHKATAIRLLKAVGKFYGDSMTNLHKGEFEIMDPNAQWSRADKDAVKDFDVMVFGGSWGTSKMFNEVILAEAKETMKSNGINVDAIEFITPGELDFSPELAGAETLSQKGTLEKPLSDMFDTNASLCNLHKAGETELKVCLAV